MNSRMTERFEQDLANPASPLAVSRVSGAPAALVAFGGIVGALGIAPFEFFNATKAATLGRVFVRDLRQSWYHAGLPGFSTNLRDTARVLEAVLGERPPRVTFVGNSMGGYAAIAFGVLLGATEVHAFSPQTFIDRHNREEHGDSRWPEAIARVHEVGDASLYDLLPVLQAYRGECRFVLHYASGDALDRIHAERLAGCGAVTLVPYAHDSHKLVTHLRDTGDLAPMLEAFARFRAG
jgi:hypothetical protein